LLHQHNLANLYCFYSKVLFLDNHAGCVFLDKNSTSCHSYLCSRDQQKLIIRASNIVSQFAFTCRSLPDLQIDCRSTYNKHSDSQRNPDPKIASRLTCNSLTRTHFSYQRLPTALVGVAVNVAQQVCAQWRPDHHTMVVNTATSVPYSLILFAAPPFTLI